MPKIKVGRWWPVLLVCALGLVLVPAALAQQGPASLTATTSLNVNLRAAPGPAGAVTGALVPNQEISVVGRSTGNNWVEVRQGDSSGWAAAWLMTFSNDTAALPITSDIEPESAPAAGPISLTSPFNLRLRQAPGVLSAAVERIPFNTELAALARSADSSWVLVEYDGQRGWIARWLTLMEADPNGLPIEAPIIDAQPTATPDAPAATARPPIIEGGAVSIVPPYRVNVRSAPLLAGEVIDVLAFGDQVQAVGRTPLNNWLEVTYGESRGWVAAWVVTATGDTAGLPITLEDVPPPPAAAQITARGFDPVAVRSQPSISAQPVGTLTPFTDVVLQGRTSDNSWALIDLDGTQGWIALWAVVASSDTAALPLGAVPAGAESPAAQPTAEPTP